MSLLLVGGLLFTCGLGSLVLTIFLAYHFPANMVRSAVAAGTVSIGGLAARVPEKKKVFSYLFKQIFYRKNWASRLSNIRLLLSHAKSSIVEIGFLPTAWSGIEYLAIIGWKTLKGFVKALLLPYAIAAGLSAIVMVLGGFCIMVAFAMWIVSVVI